MKLCVALAAVLSLACVGAASATIVDVDFVVVQSGSSAVFGDLFNGNSLSSPPWNASGSPGPVAGGFLTMHGGDVIIAPVAVDPAADTTATAQIHFTDLPTGSGVSLLLLTGTQGQDLSLTAIPSGGLFATGGSIVGAVPLLPFTDVQMIITQAANGLVSASINGFPVFNGNATPGTPVSIGISVVPEPVAMSLLAVGLGAALLRRRRA